MQSATKNTSTTSNLRWLYVKKWAFAFLCLGNFQASSQQTPTNDFAHFTEYKTANILFVDKQLNLHEADTVALLQSFLENEFSLTDGSLVLNHFTKSPIGFHLSFQQYFQGFLVFRAGCKINVANNGKVISIFDLTVDTRKFKEAKPTWTNAVWMYDGTNIHSALYSLTDSFEYITNSQGEILYADERARYLVGKDTTVQQKLFNPDPLTTAKVSYASPYKDSADANTPELNLQRVPLPLHLTWSGDTFYYYNKYAAIRKIQPQRSYNLFAYQTMPDPGRGDGDFEGLNLLYHIYQWGSYVHTLGFNSIGNYQIPCDPHGTSDDNSKFTYQGSDRVLIFGDGGVDDAEDADVVVHEYNHYLIDDCSPGTNSGFERTSMDEGSCDYFSAAYSSSLSSYQNQLVYNWDGHNQYWPGRRINSQKIYPDSMDFSSRHRTGQIWSSCLSDIRLDIGQAITDRLLYTAYFSSDRNITMPQMARLVMQADSLLNGYVNKKALCKRFTQRGILTDSCEVDPIPKDTFFVSGQDAFLEGTGPLFVKTNEPIKASLFSMDGKLIYEENLPIGKSYFTPTGLASGLYIFRLEGNTRSFTQQLIRIKNE
ncbi:MAG: T9SS type A sorting domain-containing protein [Flavobacteriaceae bacterium]|nr:T9SS type A sorting domain-containing protein [Flavobacteriaceae bacterium]